MKKPFYNLCVALLLLVVISCEQKKGEFKAIYNLKNQEWFIDKNQKFTFDVPDETKTYDVYFLIRNTISYPYYNLYFNRVLTDDKGKTLTNRMEELFLFDAKTGKPQGKGVGDMFDHKIKCSTLKGYRFPRKGKYTIAIKQQMRQDPLVGIISVGISVEPTN